MKKIAGNDLLEVLRLAPGEGTGARLMHNPLDALDGRAQMLVSLVKSWGYAAAFGAEMQEIVGCEEHRKDYTPRTRESLDQFVLKCAEVVDATYYEAERRGWLMRVPPMGEDI